MSLASIGVPGLIIILVIVLILFGPKKLPEVGAAVGKTLAEFKNQQKTLWKMKNQLPKEIKKTDQL